MTFSGLTLAPRASKWARARSTARSGCSNAAAVGSTTTSSVWAASSNAASKPRHGSLHSPPPTSARVPVASFFAIAAEPTGDGSAHPLEGSGYPAVACALAARVTGENVVDIKRVGIVGSGIMGSGVAEVAAKAGFEVTLRSRSDEGAQSMVKGLEKSLAKQVERGKLDEAEQGAVRGRVRAVTDLSELADCDLVLESIVEDLATKKELFGELSAVCRDD